MLDAGTKLGLPGRYALHNSTRATTIESRLNSLESQHLAIAGRRGRIWSNVARDIGKSRALALCVNHSVDLSH